MTLAARCDARALAADLAADEADIARRAMDAEDGAEAKAAFHLRMRAHGVRDLAVLRAVELVPRQDFVPHRYRDLALRHLALPIGCGQTLDEPWIIARMIEALAVRPEHKVLQIGAGTGYATAILAQLASEVIGLDRYQSLAEPAQSRLLSLDVPNAAIVWGDGLAVPETAGPFDRILVHGLLEDGLDNLLGRLTADGVLVCARPVAGSQTVARIERRGDELVEAAICPCRMRPLSRGTATSL